MTKHLDMEQDIRRLIEQRENELAFRAICQGDQVAMNQLQKQGVNLTIAKDREILSGPSQVESLLRFMVDREIEKAFEDAEGDNIVYEKLGDHRILGKAKKKKKKMRSY